MFIETTNDGNCEAHQISFTFDIDITNQCTVVNFQLQMKYTNETLYPKRNKSAQASFLVTKCYTLTSLGYLSKDTLSKIFAFTSLYSDPLTIFSPQPKENKRNKEVV